MRSIGFVVNPIAGMGGRVGLKGTDGKVAKARERGAEPRAPDRAKTALHVLFNTDIDIQLYTYGSQMGASEVEAVGGDAIIVGTPGSNSTSAEDTKDAVKEFIKKDVDLILFVGGDGTAVDIANVLKKEDASIPMLGIPAGVKVYSSVFAVSPESAGRIAAEYDTTEPKEINDLDEEAYRQGRVETELKAVVQVPVAQDMQASKQTYRGNIDTLAQGVSEDIESDIVYILGPGGTLSRIKQELGFDGTRLGVDVWRDEQVLVEDATASEINANLGDQNEIIVSPIGGQGFIFGRGNDQISPEIIRQSEVTVVASRTKLDDIGVLRVDTGDPKLDKSLQGWTRVRIGRYEHRLIKVVAATALD
ncbi:MAG: ATP-NAD kinase family protein [Halobacteriaceae archaeon]